jgi:site-specific DNA-methyltransferase (adenine-specific)
MRQEKTMSECEGKKKPYAVLNADCLDAMKRMPDNCVDAVVTDPPYGLDFMGKNWDHGVPGIEFWKEALRVAKPGAHLLAFGGTRTYHRLACAIEDAGWEVRDCLGWIYSSGMPKSMDISKAIDKKLGAQRAVRAAIGDHEGTIDFGMKNRCPKCGKPFFSANPCTCPREDLVPITEEAKKWSGWGTCLKPAFEPIILARKPLEEGTVADNVLKWGVGGLNIDECRVSTTDNLNGGAYSKSGNRGNLSGDQRDAKGAGMFAPGKTVGRDFVQPSGRFPANLIHDGSDEVLEVFPDNVKGGTWNRTKGARPFNNNGEPTEYTTAGSDASIGSAARFFYCPKASKKEKGKENIHPTVKPIELMKYLVKLVSPKGALVLDPFMGSGSTGVAAVQIGRRFLGVEKEGEYFNYAKKRIETALQNAEEEV